MTRHDDTVYVRHMMDAAREAIELSAKITRSDLAPFGVETLALTRLLEIVGEAARRTSQSFRSKYPEVEWKEIAGTRDRLIHGYDVVDFDRLWDTCINDLPSLLTKLERVLRDEVGE